MLLAVNTETFLDVTYDEAVTILRNLSGNIRFLIATPKEVQKLKEEEEAGGGGGGDTLAPEGTFSRTY